MAANTAYPPSSSVATTPTSPATFAHQQNFVSPSSNRRQSVRPGARGGADAVAVSSANGIGGLPPSPNILDPPPGLSYADFVAQWQDVHIARWLTDIKCAQYAQAFKDNDIRGDIILELDMDTLKEIGLTSVGDRTRIRNAIKHLRQRCQRPSAGPRLLLNGSPNDVKISTGIGLKLNGDAANNGQDTVDPYPTAARGHRRLESVRPPPLQIENVRPRDLPRVERGNGNGSGGSTQAPDSARALSTPRIAQPPPLGAPPRVTNTRGIPNIPPAPKGLPPMPPGAPKPRLQVPPSALRGARTPTQETAPPPPWTSDPLPPQPAPTSPWSSSREYGLPRKITPGNIGGRTTSPSARGVGVSGIRSPGITHQKQSSFANTPPALNPLKLGSGGAASSHPYASNAGMGIGSHVLTPVQENFNTAAPGYSVGRGPFPQRGQSVSTTTTTASDDFRRKTLKFHLRDSGSRMIEVKEFDGGSEILERALKKFNVKVNTNDLEYADVDGLHIDGWAVFLGPDADLPSKALSESELLAIFHSDPGDPPRENLHLRRLHSPSSYRTPQRQPTSPTTTQYNTEALNTLQATNRTATKKMNRASTVSVLSGLGMQVSSPPASPGGTTLKSPRLGKLRNFFGHRPPSELITTHLQEYFPFTDRKVLNRTARNSVMRKRQTMGVSAGGGGAQWPPRFASRFSTSTTTSGSGGEADGFASSRNSLAGNSLVEEEEELPKEKGPHLNLPRMSVETVDGRSVDLTLIDDGAQLPPAATSKKLKRRTQLMLPPVSIDSDSFADQISQNLGVSSSASAAGDKDKAARRASKRVSKIVELKSKEMPNDAGQIPTVENVTSGIEASRRASHASLRPTSGLGGTLVEPPSRRASMAEVPIDEEEAVAQQEEEEEEEEEEYYEEEEEGEEEEEEEEGEEEEEEEEDEEDTLVDTDAPAKITSKATTKTIKWIRGALIGSGSFGNVYLGMDSQRGLLMAVKQVELKGSASDERKKAMLSALEREIDLLKQLQHENIVQYLDSSIDEDNLNIFLEYVPGGSVASLLKNYGAFEESLTVNWVRQILRGLEYLHGQTIIHRDIKGANILVDNKGGIKLSDFGVSKKVEDTLPKNHRPSLQGSVFWMAPEVVKQTAYTSKADIWSLGCLIIEMLTGQHPFPEFSQMQAIFKIGSGSARPTIPSDITAEGTDFLQKTFEIDHTLRPSASELAVYAWMAEK